MNMELLNSLQIGAVFKGSEYPCVGLSFSRDGSSLGVGFEDGTVNVIDPDTAKPVRTHRSHKYGLSKFCYLNNDATGSLAVAVASPTVIEYDPSIRVWDLVQNRFCRIFKGHEALISTVSPHQSRDILISSDEGGQTNIWDLREERPVWECRDGPKSISAFDKAAGSHIFAVSLPASNTITLYDLRKTETPLTTIKGNSNPVDEIVFSNNGEKLLVGSHKLGAVSSYNTESGALESIYFLLPTKTRFNLDTSPCSTYALATTPANTVDIWDIKSRVKIRSLVGHDGPPIGAFSPSLALIATASLPIALWAPLSA